MVARGEIRLRVFLTRENNGRSIITISGRAW